MLVEVESAKTFECVHLRGGGIVLFEDFYRLLRRAGLYAWQIQGTSNFAIQGAMTAIIQGKVISPGQIQFSSGNSVIHSLLNKQKWQT